MTRYLVTFTIEADSVEAALDRAEDIVGGDCNVVRIGDNSYDLVQRRDGMETHTLHTVPVPVMAKVTEVCVVGCGDCDACRASRGK